MTQINEKQGCAFITGASRNIGRAIALRLAQDGDNIVIVDPAPAQDTVKEIEELGVRALAIAADVSNFEQMKDAVAQAVAAFGSIDKLVNNAGITRDNLLLSMKEEEFDAVIAVNLKGVFHGMKFVGAQMLRQKRGRIVNIASISGLLGNVGQANYAASKAGIIGMSKSAARELASRGITVNCIAPGFFKTAMVDAMNEKAREKLLATVPMGRMGEVWELAELAAFLLSDKAAYITGQTLTIDGGMVMQ